MVEVELLDDNNTDGGGMGVRDVVRCRHFLNNVLRDEEIGAERVQARGRVAVVDVVFLGPKYSPQCM